MTAARRLEQLAAQYELPPAAAPSLGRLLDLLARDPTAPTAVREPTAAVDAHIADALVALELAAVRRAPCGAARGELHRDERVGDVGVDARGRLADGRRRGGVAGEQVEQSLERGDGGGRQLVLRGELLEPSRSRPRRPRSSTRAI